MSIKKIVLVAVAICGIVLGALFISIARETPRVMVLHSYATDYVWTNLVNQSLSSALKESNFDVETRYFYMNTRSPDYRAEAESIEQSFVETVETFDPKVIIAIDDAAQKIISKHYLNHPNIGVVFSGVNYSVEKYGYLDANNITGIFEHKSIKQIKKVIRELSQLQGMTQPASIIFLADDSTSSHKNADFLAMQDWEDFDYLGAQHTTDYAKWQEFITQKSNQYDYILVSGYRQLLDENGERVAPDITATWTQANSRSGLIGMNVFNSKDGIMLSIGVSPHEQGIQALNMAFQIIKGHSPDQIPYHYPEHYIVALKEHVLNEHALLNHEVQPNYKKALLDCFSTARKAPNFSFLSAHEYNQCDF